MKSFPSRFGSLILSALSGFGKGQEVFYPSRAAIYYPSNHACQQGRDAGQGAEEFWKEVDAQLPKQP